MDPNVKEISKRDPDVICNYCHKSEINSLEWGPLYQLEGVTVHYFCMLFSAGLSQNGEDEEGILGFMPKDIRKELKRGAKLVCVKYLIGHFVNKFEKLINIERDSLLIPRSKLLCDYLKLHGNQNLQHRDQNLGTASNNKRDIFIVMPFYGNLRKQGSIIRKSFISELIKCRSESLKKCVMDISVNIAFNIPNSLTRFIDKWNI